MVYFGPVVFLIEAVLPFEFVENSFLMIASIFFSSIEDAGDVDKVLFAKFLNILNRDCLINGVEFSSQGRLFQVVLCV